jgi:hypothetical protein
MTLIPCTGKNGSLNFKDNDSGVFIHSYFDPQKESIRLYSQLPEFKGTPLICFGLGACYILSAILESSSPLPSKVVVYEPEKDLYHLPELKKKS